MARWVRLYPFRVSGSAQSRLRGTLPHETKCHEHPQSTTKPHRGTTPGIWVGFQTLSAKHVLADPVCFDATANLYLFVVAHVHVSPHVHMPPFSANSSQTSSARPRNRYRIVDERFDTRRSLLASASVCSHGVEMVSRLSNCTGCPSCSPSNLPLHATPSRPAPHRLVFFADRELLYFERIPLTINSLCTRETTSRQHKRFNPAHTP